MSLEKLFDMLRMFEFSKYYATFTYFQAAVSAMLALSAFVLWKKNQNKYYVIFWKFENSTHIKELFLWHASNICKVGNYLPYTHLHL